MGPAGLKGARTLQILVPLVLLAVFCYYPALSGAFISDDRVLVLENPATRSPGAALSSFGRSYWHGLKAVRPYYRPIPVLSYSVDRSLAGSRPFLFHATNLLLHAACAALAALLVLGLAARTGDPGARFTRSGNPVASHAGAFLAGALVAAHPLHTEPVAAIYGRPDLLAAAGGLLFLNLAVRGRYFTALAALAAALLSKESAAALPLLAPFAFALAARPRKRARQAFLAGLAGAAAVAFGYLLLRHQALGALMDPGAVNRLDNPLVEAEPLSRWLTPFGVVSRYARLWIWPSSLCADHGFDTVPLATGLGETHVLAGVALVAVALAGLILLTLRRSGWALPLAGALLAWLPASSLIVLSPVLMAERLVYLSSILLCVLAGGLYALLAVRAGGSSGGAAGWPFGRAGLHMILALVVIGLGGRTFLRASDFRSDLAFYGSAAQACPRSVKAQYNLGNALSRSGQLPEAAEAFERSVALAPWLGIARDNLGAAYLNMGRLDDAEAAYRGALEAEPALVVARASLAGILYMQGRLEEALKEVEEALAGAPSPGDAAQLEELARRIRLRSEPKPSARP
jgi:tetratricopeptide (TPR) repeat protein